ncbi:hypothetical protein [Parahaliea mediterranea]|uniref:Cytochrome C n=1 Tax=Parahaliea mediterranea TaxID=651086 RepID=A0A939IJF0_9GAMM|nr:hypothetical protein [Parahaliea mediterranea]MBN7797594.1 hypothetical protein [Parahaliea mediterranea]
MRALRLFFSIHAAWLAVSLAAVAAEGPPSGLGAAMNYQLHCEGCHKADGTGQPGFIPRFTGVIGGLLAAPSGRDYLARVPGVAQSLLSDGDTAAVLNWILRTYDPAGIPADFRPYRAGDIARARRAPLSDATVHRQRLVNGLAGPGIDADRDSQPAPLTAN